MAVQRTRNLGHLHQTQRTLLHPCSTRSGDQHQHQPPNGSVLDQTRDLLSDDAAHTAAHEFEGHHPESDRYTIDQARTGLYRILGFGIFLVLGQPFRVKFLVVKSEGVSCAIEFVHRTPRPGVDQASDALFRRHGDIFATFFARVMVLR